MKIHDMEQQSDAWHAIRKGKMTASNAQAIATNAKGLDTYIYKTVSAYYSSGEVDFYSNKQMDRGNELEGQARAIYELENDVKVEEVGFVELDEYTGASPDGLVGEDTIIEIKCHDDVKHFKLIVNGESEIESKYRWQIQMTLLVTGRKTGIYVAYNPNFEKSLLTFTIEKDEDMHARLRAGLATGKAKIMVLKDQLLNNTK